jgi:hypothetical protein
VRALDVESWAAARACEPIRAGSSGLSALLNLGWTAAHLVVLRDGIVIHERYLSDHGLRNLHAPFSEAFDLDAEDFGELTWSWPCRPSSCCSTT